MTNTQLSSSFVNIQIPIARANGTFTVSNVVNVPAGLGLMGIFTG